MNRLLLLLSVLFWTCLSAVAGVPTVGLSNSTADYKQLTNEGFQDTIRRCLIQNGTAHILPGTYQFTAPLRGEFNNVKITGTSGTVLRAVASGAVGLFDMSGDNVIMEGFRAQATTFVNSQSLIRFRGTHYSAATITILASDDSYNDSSGGLPIFPVGAEVYVTGATTAGNNGEKIVVSSTATKLVTYAVAGLGYGLTDDASAGETTTFTRVIHNPCVDDVTFEMNTSPAADIATPPTVIGSESTPMVCVEFSGVAGKRVRGCHFLPNYAVTCIKSTAGNGYMFTQNHFDNGMGAGLGSGSGSGSLTLLTPRLMYRGIEIQGDEWGDISFNRFWALGEDLGLMFAGGAKNVDSAIYLNSLAAGSVDEGNHSQVSNNRIEMVQSPYVIRLNGVNSVDIFNNLLGLNGSVSGTPDALGEAGIVIGARIGSNGVAVDADVSYSVQITGNDLHNLAEASTDGAFIYLQRCSDVQIKANRFGVQASNQAIAIAAGTSERFTIIGNSFSAESGVPRAIYLSDHTNFITKGCYIGSNSFQGFLYPILDESMAGAASRRKILTGLDDGFQNQGIQRMSFATGVTFDTTAETIAHAGNDLNMFGVGDLISISGADDQANNTVTNALTAGAGSFTVAANLTTDAASSGSVTIQRLDHDYAITLATLAFATAGDTIADSASGMGLLRVGDVIGITGSGTQANDIVTTLTAAAAGSLTVAANLTDDGADADVTTIRRYTPETIYTNSTFAFSTTAETITDSANGLGYLSIGDVIAITGSGAQANDLVTTVLTVAAAGGSITVTHNLTDDVADADVTTIRKLKRKPTTNVQMDR